MRIGKYLFFILAALSAIGYLSVLFISKDFPIYPDEPDWKLVQDHLLIDHFKLIYLFPFCTSSYLQNVPWTWIPSRIFESLIYQDLRNIQKLRYLGIFGFIAWSMIAAKVLLDPLKAKLSYFIRLILLWSCFSIGFLPLILVLSRPEQLLLFYLALLLLVWQFRENTSAQSYSWQKHLGYSILVVLLSWAAMSVHPKAVYFIPAMLVVLHRSVRGVLIKLTMSSCILFSGFETIKLWSARLNCPENPVVQTFLQGLSVNPTLLFKDRKSFSSASFENFKSVKIYWNHITFSNLIHQGNFLPDTRQVASAIDKILDYMPLVFIVVGVLFFSFFLIGALKKGSINLKRYFYEILVMASLLLFIFCDFAFQNYKNFYEIGILWPVLLFLFFIGCRSFLKDVDVKIIKSLIGFIFILSTLNSGAILLRYLEWQPNWSAVEKGFQNNYSAVSNLAQRCGIDVKTASNLVLDAASFPAMSMTATPVMWSYIFGYYGFHEDPLKVVDALHLSYFIGACDPLPKKYDALIIRDGLGYCCVDLRK
jgi:hypothetical protein